MGNVREREKFYGKSNWNKNKEWLNGLHNRLDTGKEKNWEVGDKTKGLKEWNRIAKNCVTKDTTHMSWEHSEEKRTEETLEVTAASLPNPWSGQH